MKTLYNILVICIGIIVYGQPSGACVAGTTKLDATGHLYGCVVDRWVKISEDYPDTSVYSTTSGSTGLLSNNVMLRVNGENFQLPNVNFVPLLPSAISDAPSHAIGKVFYSKANEHFYQGVDSNKWHQIDNEYTSTESVSLSDTFTRNNCPDRHIGQTIIYTTPIFTETRTSTVSQDEADFLAQKAANEKALSDLANNGQTYANMFGDCIHLPPECIEWDYPPNRYDEPSNPPPPVCVKWLE